MVFEIVAIVAVIGLIAGFGTFKLNPVVGIMTGLSLLVVFLSITVAAIFGDAGFLGTLQENPFIAGLIAFSAAFVVGDTVSALI